MFGSNGPCPMSPTEYLPHYGILEPLYLPRERQDSETEEHSSAPPTPDVISGLISLTGSGQYSEISGSSFGDLTSPEDFQAGSPPTSVTSSTLDVSRVQATRTKLIKEGLKLTIQSRRMVHGLDNVRLEYRSPPQEELTKEDEERRLRRRERNKVAATKCRNKKKERTGKLAEESESLQVNNSALRKEICSLEAEKKKLLDILSSHLPHCGLPTVHGPCSQAQNRHRWPAVLG